MRAATLLVATLLALALSPTLACTDNSGNGNGPGGGGTTGSAGTTGGGGTTGSAGTTGSGGTSAGFRAVAPCNVEGDYMTGTTVDFSSTTTFAYNPKCLKVATGASVTFNGVFSTHPLSPSAMRGDTSNNPITDTASGTTKSFTFPDAGFFAYFCDFHGPSDTGAGMAGVIWVE